MVTLSIVVPLYCEAPNLEQLFERLERVLAQLDLSHEIICVDDGSKDETLDLLILHRHRNSAIKVIALSRNFGKDIAMTAGIDYAQGDAVIPMDADLQDPPELIGALVEKWREGYEVVYAQRRSRQGESWVKRTTAKAFYRLISAMTAIAIPRDTGDFRLMDRRAVEALKQLPERTRFMKGLFAWVGFRQIALPYDRAQRHRGRSKWNYWRLWNFALDGITSFSFGPLRIWSYVGLAIALAAFCRGTFLVLRTLIFGIDVPGYASLMVTMLFLGGVQLMTLGIMGEYLGRIYEEVKGRPLYLVRELYGLAEAEVLASRPGSPSGGAGAAGRRSP